jgi:cytochrome c oxidase assembly factor CtaG
VLTTAALYLHGWRRLSRRMPARFGARHLAATMTGLASILLALTSPLDALSTLLLQAHMTQHMLLMLVAPPLLWMGAPVAPMLLGLPRPVRRTVTRALAVPQVRQLSHVLSDPVVSWVTFVVAFWAWHIPALYDLALRSDGWHHVEHACFFLTALLFWRLVILSWPTRSSWPRWAMIPYLALADLQNSALAAILTFSDRVIYPTYAAAPRLWGLSALEDQAIAGVIMWVPGSLAFLLPVLWLVATVLVAPEPDRMRAGVRPSSQEATRPEADQRRPRRREILVARESRRSRGDVSPDHPETDEEFAVRSCGWN